ncbi:hypothetical protein K443DRAFT_680439 [Laccaria amethystina LaAM-08-1]|uniref:Uncharacterized protein n=1 Tax=Laccaria amethystina LaAM-08-1 TaxID=1095629 RepID=A0A0C9XB95_9AGAR|nr:hypothetical protein K443DRAFT_680439 [Laccaria amethystina LaAM-08-1]
MTMPRLVETQRDIHSPEIMATPSGCASTGAFGGSRSDERRQDAWHKSATYSKRPFTVTDGHTAVNAACRIGEQ